MGPKLAVASGQSLGVQVNVNAMAAIVQAMVAGGRPVLEDGDWLRMQTAEARLAPHEQAGLEALRTHLRNGATVLKETSTTTWYG